MGIGLNIIKKKKEFYIMLAYLLNNKRPSCPSSETKYSHPVLLLNMFVKKKKKSSRKIFLEGARTHGPKTDDDLRDALMSWIL